LTPASDSLLLGTTRLFAASVTNQFNQARSAPVLWSSSNQTVLTVGNDGLVTAVGLGSAQVIAAIQGHADTALVRVYGSPLALQVIPEVLSLAVGDDFQISTDAGGSLGAGQVVWSVSDTNIVSISPTGLVTGLEAGEAEVTARVGAAKATGGVGVFAVPVATVTVSPASATVPAGGSVLLEATPRSSTGKVLRRRATTWTTSNAQVATVDQQGRVSGVARGYATITATIEGISGAATINVSSQAVASVRASMTDSSLVTGQKVQATATGLDASGSPIIGLPVGWQSANPAIATVTSAGIVAGVAAGNTLISAIIGGQVGSIPVTVSGATPTSVVIIPSSPAVAVGGTAQLTGEVRDQNGLKIAGMAITWSSSNSAVATVSSAGLLTGVAQGTATITATSGQLSASTTATVNAAKVASISVSPATASLLAGDSLALVATVKAEGGTTLAGRVVTWGSSAPQVASVDEKGLVTAVAAGNAVITASSEGKSATSSVTVTAPAPVVSSVTVTLNSSSLQVGQSTQAVAVVYDAQGKPVPGASVTWSSSNPAVATVGQGGMVTAVGGGSVSIRAVSGGVLGAAGLTVAVPAPAPVASVSITLSPTSISAGQVSQATVVLRDSAGNTLTGRTVGYSSNNPAVATVSAGGSVTGVASGTAQITATSEGKSGSATLSVSGGTVAVSSVSVSAPTTTLAAGDTTRASATALDQTGHTLSGVSFTWRSSDTSVARVGTLGKVTGRTSGSATITATTSGVSGSLGFVVTVGSQATCASVTLSLNASSLAVGQTTQATAVARDSAGNVVTGQTFTFSSSNTAVATVSSAGLVTAVTSGSATISASCGTANGSASVTVTTSTAPVASVSVTLTPNSITVGQTAAAAAVLKDAAGIVLTGRTITWSVTAGTGVASVSSTGTVTALATGSATITATSGGVSGSAILTVMVPGAIATPQLPRSVPSFPSSLMSRPCTDRPTTATALQQALNAGGSRTICLSPGLVLKGYWDIPARAAGDTAWSVLRADMSFTPGQRITGSEPLPRLIITDVRFPALWFHSRSARWLVQGLELTSDSTITAGPMALVEVGERISERTLADLPRDIHFSHMDLHGWPLQNLRRGWVLNGAGHVVRDSRCTEIHERNSDSQCTLSYNGPGPFLIENNLLEAASENIMWGGGDPAISGLVPCDITVRGNLVRKPIAWKSVGTPTQSGSYLIKLLYEAKNSCRALVEQNHFDGVWMDGQTGYAIGLKSVNQSGGCTWCRVTDQTFRNNTIVHVGAGFGIAGAPEKYPVDTVASRIMFSGNWIDSLNVNPYTGDARGILILARARDLSFVRNTWAGGNWTRESIILDLSGSTPAVTNFRFDNNVMPIGLGVGATAVGEGTKALNAAVAGTWSFSNNTFIGAARSGYPATTQWAASLSAALATGAGITQRPVP
jgi:uncharacterized protein YjdB